MSIYDQWTIDDAKLAAQLSTEQAKDLESFRAFVSGSHFQGWDGWIGPKPLDGDKNAMDVRAEIERGFVSYNALGEGVGRHVNGCLGRDVKFSVVTRRKLPQDQTPTPDEQTRIDEATDLLTKWVDDRKLNQEFDKVAEELLVAGLAYLRPFVAPGQVDANGVVPTADLATSLNRVYFSHPLRGEAVVWTDPSTQQRCSIYLYRQVTSSRPSQVQGKQGDERAELTYLDGDATIIRIVGADSESIDPNGFSYPLGKRVLMADMARKPLLNPQVVSLQKLLNLALTMLERNVILGGFLERVATNAQMNGHYEDQPDGTRKYIYDEVPIGAGAMTALTGYILRDAAGNESIATPNMLWRDPVDVKTFLDTVGAAYERILAEMNQAHYAAAGSTGISAEARLVSMAAYLIDLLQTKQQVDAGFSWLLETALALAAILAGLAGRFDDLRVSAECSVDPGPISADEKRVAMDLTGGQPLLSVKTAQSRIGVEDTDGEQQQMDKEAEKAAETQGADLSGVQSLVDKLRGQNGTAPVSASVPANGVPANGQPVAAA